MKTRSAGLLLVCLLAVTAMAADAIQTGEVRLTAADIAAMSKGGAGAGTSGVAGIRTTILAGDPARPGPYTIEIRVPANTRIQAHTHRDARSAVVVSGRWFFGYGDHAVETGVKELAAGSFYTEPANRAHFALTRTEPAVVYITGTGPTDTLYTTSIKQEASP
jgi:quercetin dioxygenase-like cupin family protein